MEVDRNNSGSNKPTAKWDAEKGRYTESGNGVADERQTDKLDHELDPGSFAGDVDRDESLTKDEL